MRNIHLPYISFYALKRGETATTCGCVFVVYNVTNKATNKTYSK